MAAIDPMTRDARFADLGRPSRIWAIPASHGDAEALAALHTALAPRLGFQDRIVYLGGFLGGPCDAALIDHLIAYRRWFIARPGALHTDVVYLRGAVEEMWHKLLQLQFAASPTDVLDWMLARGLEAPLRAYGSDASEGRLAAKTGIQSLTRWTSRLRARIHAAPGHRAWFSTIRRAARTSYHRLPGTEPRGELLFVHAGMAPDRPLDKQKDHFWWGHPAFERLQTAPAGFRRVIRGAMPGHQGDTVPTGQPGDGPVLTLLKEPDDGRLCAYAIGPDGEITDIAGPPRKLRAASA